ncbi:helix-turn-helix transcriptional regulator [Lachnospiraceae bacterium 38-10]
MNQEQTDITTGKQIRHLRTQSGMTQEELAGELHVTRQALSNWERDVNEPDLNTLKKICFLFGVHMDDFAKEVITKMETYEKKERLGASLFGGGCFSFVFGLICHAVITLRRNDR